MGFVMIEGLRFLEDDTVTPCEAYTALWKVRLEDARRWAFALYLVGAVAALGLVGAIALFALGQNGAGLASGVGTVLTGGAFGVLWSRRTEVQKEAAEFLAKVKEYCSDDRRRDLGVI